MFAVKLVEVAESVDMRIGSSISLCAYIAGKMMEEREIYKRIIYLYTYVYIFFGRAEAIEYVEACLKEPLGYSQFFLTIRPIHAPMNQENIKVLLPTSLFIFDGDTEISCGVFASSQ